jgi:predicted nucleic acid-binding protein
VSVVAVDSSCLVAAACSWHEHHEATLGAMGASAGQHLVVPAHALIEAYAVLTRLPPPHRLAPSDAFAVLEGSWRSAAVHAIDSETHWRTLQSLAAAEVAGGAAYDALIAAAAKAAGASVILSWNRAHFERLGSLSPEPRSPA